MSHADKQLRRKRRREKKLRLSSWSDRTISELDRDIPSTLRLLEYDITEEPLGLAEERDPDLQAAIADRRQLLFGRVHNEPHLAIPELEALLERFPNSSLLMNWLGNAYQGIGDTQKSESMVRLCHQRHPDYLFARTNLAALHLGNGETAEAQAVMHNHWDLKLMYPDRDVFHISEFVAMDYVAVDYYLQTGKPEAAELIVKAMKEVTPGYEATQLAQKMLAGSFIARVIRRLSPSARRRHRTGD